MINIDPFIEYLEKEKEKNQPFLHVDHFDLVKKMLPYIGHIDPYVRDDIIYECLAYCVEYLKNDDLQTLVKIYLSEDYLFYDIKNQLSYSVVKRTFTLLQLAVILYLHAKKGVLNIALVKDIANSMVRYLKEEEILKGYDEKVGWMHSLAHSADVLGRLFQIEDLPQDLQEDLLDMLVYKIQQNNYVYIDGEEERVVEAILKGLNHGFLAVELVEDFSLKLARIEQQETYREYFKIHLNIKAVLSTLYFALYKEEKYIDLRKSIAKALEGIRKDKIKKS